MVGLFLLSQVSSAQLVEKKIDDNQLIAYWSFDNDSGKIVYDKSRNKLNGKIYGDVEYVEGLVGKAIQLNMGENEPSGYIEIAYSEKLKMLSKGYTIMFWAYLPIESDNETRTGWPTMISQYKPAEKKDKKAEGWSIYFYPGNYAKVNPSEWGKKAHGALSLFHTQKGRVKYHVWTDAKDVQTCGWHHYTFTFDGNQTEMYFDGKMVSRMPKMTAPAILDIPILIGVRGDFLKSTFFSGKIDEVYIYKVALSKKEIGGYYKSFSTTKMTQRPQQPSLLFIGHREHLYTGLAYFKKFLNELVGKGYNVDYQYLEEPYYNYSGNVDISKFNKYNAIIYLGTPNWNFKTHQTTKSFKAQINALRKYVEGGGGVLICPYVGPSQRPSVWDMLEPWGLKVLNATIHDRNSVVKTVMQIRFAYTNNIVVHPVTKGVKGVWYPVYPKGGYVWNANTVPFKVDKNWQVLVKGAKTSYVIPYKFNYPEIDKKFSDKENTITSSPPLVAIREVGKGRVAFIGIQSHYHIFSGNAPC